MGQQQLLLLVFGIVVVALALLVGLSAFDDRMNQTAVDNLVNRNLEIANSAVFWKTKRDPFNGGNAAYTGLSDDGLAKLFMETETNMGTFAITDATEGTLEITGVAKRDENLGVRTYVNGYRIDSTRVSYAGAYAIEE